MIMWSVTRYKVLKNTLIYVVIGGGVGGGVGVERAPSPNVPRSSLCRQRHRHIGRFHVWHSLETSYMNLVCIQIGFNSKKSHQFVYIIHRLCHRQKLFVLRVTSMCYFLRFTSTEQPVCMYKCSLLSQRQQREGTHTVLYKSRRRCCR